jgi:hypothetical protein
MVRLECDLSGELADDEVNEKEKSKKKVQVRQWRYVKSRQDTSRAVVLV